MNEKCKYCDYVLKCSRFCEYNSIMCLIHRSFPKIVDKTYEELEKENRKYKEVIDKAIKYINGAYEMAIYTKSVSLEEENIEDLLDILKEVE